MAETADAIVIGAGIMGAATAYHLARRKFGRVVVLERDGICSGSTALASGGIRHQYANRIGIELTRQSIVVYENFAAEFGVDPQFRQHGYLILQQTEEESRLYAESAATQCALGVDTRSSLRTRCARGGRTCTPTTWSPRPTRPATASPIPTWSPPRSRRGPATSER